jgi:hypothetical protein
MLDYKKRLGLKRMYEFEPFEAKVKELYKLKFPELDVTRNYYALSTKDSRAVLTTDPDTPERLRLELHKLFNKIFSPKDKGIR